MSEAMYRSSEYATVDCKGNGQKSESYVGRDANEDSGLDVLLDVD